MLIEKGRLVVPRSYKRLDPEQVMERADASAKIKLGEETHSKLLANYSALSMASKRKRKKLEDGMIMALLQQNMTASEIRSMFKCGNSRIRRIRKIMKNPSILEKTRPVPKHAVTEEDLKDLMAHISTYETEDSYPCAHRKILKFFIVPGLT